MEKITMTGLEELISKDEALSARAKEITGEGEALKERVRAFAASLGYELVPDAPKELSIEELEKVSGGRRVGGPKLKRPNKCNHDWQYVGKVKGALWGYNDKYVCSKCHEEKIDIVWFG